MANSEQPAQRLRANLPSSYRYWSRHGLSIHFDRVSRQQLLDAGLIDQAHDCGPKRGAAKVYWEMPQGGQLTLSRRADGLLNARFNGMHAIRRDAAFFAFLTAVLTGVAE
jgi:hypothetical protein